MTSKLRQNVLAQLALFMALAIASPLLRSQAPSRFLGTITAINGDTLTVKTDAGDVRQVQVPAAAALKRIAPGQKDLSTAETIKFSDLESGDRVLVKLDTAATVGTPQALQVVAVKQADVATKQQKDRDDWQRNGVGGLVKSVDATAGAVQLTTGAGATAKTVTVHVTKATVLKRYAPASVRFDDAQVAPIDAIHAGDQLRARGVKNADGTEINAEEVISGSFRNISGTILSLDAAASTLTVKDLMSKKSVTIHIGAETQMRRLPDTMAKMIAARLKSGTTGNGGAAVGESRPQAGGAAGEQRGSYGQQGGGAAMGQPGAGGPGRGAGGNGDMQQVLSRAPTIQFSELQKGEAVMLVSTQGAADVTAITLVAGVEPLLEAPAASQNLLSNWSMGSGSAEAAAQ
jgi:hypothetical protein